MGDGSGDKSQLAEILQAVQKIEAFFFGAGGSQSMSKHDYFQLHGCNVDSLSPMYRSFAAFQTGPESVPLIQKR